MRYNKGESLRWDAERVIRGVAANQSQESLDDQLKDLIVLAIRFGLYDAGEWLKDLMSHHEQVERDFGTCACGDPLDDGSGWYHVCYTKTGTHSQVIV